MTEKHCKIFASSLNESEVSNWCSWSLFGSRLCCRFRAVAQSCLIKTSAGSNVNCGRRRNAESSMHELRVCRQSRWPTLQGKRPSGVINKVNQWTQRKQLMMGWIPEMTMCVCLCWENKTSKYPAMVGYNTGQNVKSSSKYSRKKSFERPSESLGNHRSRPVNLTAWRAGNTDILGVLKGLKLVF